MALDFEGILGFFRASLPKKFQSEEDCQLLFHTMSTIKVNEKKLSKLQKDYQSYLEQQAQLEDPVMRLERDNKALRDTIHRLEQENDNLAQDLVGSKIKLRTEMDKVLMYIGLRRSTKSDGKQSNAALHQ
jgi:septal ring factor EnvC (AmiA/AmiB activator)